jgi:hypothetical protein
MAELGGGRFYLVEDATRLPSVFAQETILASRSAINELEFVPRARGSSPVLAGVDVASAPPLSGYVVTIPKARAQVLLSGPENDPILATWSAGVGRAGAFTSDYKDRWGARWTQWEGAARLFAQLGRELARRVDDPRVRLEADIVMGELSVRASVLDDRGRHESLRRLRARVAGPDGFSREITLEAVGSGSYAASTSLSRPGAYVVTLIDDETSQALSTTGAALSAGDELQPSGTDRAFLRRLSEVSGGTVRDTLAGVFNDRAGRRFAYDPLSQLLAILAALSLLFTVAARRIALPVRRAKPITRVSRDADPAATEPPPKASLTATLTALRARKDRADSVSAQTADLVESTLPLRSPHAPTPPSVTRPPAVPAASDAEPTAVAGRQRTAAEILIERRRSRIRK